MVAAATNQVILLVDAELPLRETLASHLEGSGFTVIQTGNALSAIGMLLQPLTMVDLVITGIEMPGTMDGMALAKWVTRYRPNIPVIITAGDAEKPGVIQQWGEAAATGKPFDYPALTGQIRAAISRHREKS